MEPPRLPTGPAALASTDAPSDFVKVGSETPLPLDSQDTSAGGPGGQEGPVTPQPQPGGAEPELPTPTMLGDFRLLKKLGEGSMGVVYKARQVSADRRVAVKVLFEHVAKNPKHLERFYREARVMIRLNHPNFVSGYAVGEDQGVHYFAMEYIDGPSLQELRSRLGRLRVGDALHIILICAQALQFAHELNLVHRDIKTANILLTKSGTVKIADLGMIKLLTDDVSMTQTGYGVGTPSYMPLEQARSGKDADGRSDIYALGCVFYALLTGQMPFKGDNIVELIQAKEMGTFPPARRFNPDVPERLDLMLLKMLAKLPQQRYQACAELIRDLNSLGLAHPSLSFLAPKGGPQPAPVPAAGGAPRTETPNAGCWFVRYETAAGQHVTRRLMTAAVLDLIKDEDFDVGAMASRTFEGGYRALSSYKEFEHIMLRRVIKTAADQQTTRFRAQYKKLDAEDRRRRPGAANETGRAKARRYWRGGLVWLFTLGVLGATGYLIYIIIRFLVVEMPAIFG